MYKNAEAKSLEERARQLRKEAFDERPLPDFWRKGQKVRFLHEKEWAWGAGAVAEVIEVRDGSIPADKYQVFWASQDKGKTRFWTTPDEVELVSDVVSE